MKHSALLRPLLLLIAFSMAIVLVAQRVQVRGTTNAIVGEPTRIQYVIDHSDVQVVTPPSIQGSHVELIAGPAISSQRSTSVSFSRGGAQKHSSASTTISFTYLADKATAITLSPAVFEVDGKTVRSSSHSIKFSGSATPQGGTQAQSPSANAKANGSKGIIIRTIANKRSVYEQEAILLSYRVLSPTNLASLSGGLPSLKEFLRQDIPLPQDKQVTAETVNGKLYRSVLWSQHVLFPQQTGRLTIPSFELKGVTQEVDRNIDPLDAFFNGGNALITTPFVRSTEALAIEVKPLPSNKPADFSGGVGQFTMQVEPPTEAPRTNEAYRLRIIINGLGNHKLITAPKVVFPKNFQTFDTKSGVQTELTPDGLRGSITFDYTAVPKSTGQFDIPEITFVYFDTQQGDFRTLRHKGLTLHVEQGSAQAPTVDGARPDDISPLRLDDGYTFPLSSATPSTTTFVLLLAGVLVVFVLVLILLRKEIAARSNKVLQRQRRALSVAQHTLRGLNTADTKAFYSALAQAIHTYITHHTASATPVLSAKEGYDILTTHGVNAELIARYDSLMARCEQAAYAGQATSASLEAEREEALTIVQLIEQQPHA